jgi:hypothetical protein
MVLRYQPIESLLRRLEPRLAPPGRPEAPLVEPAVFDVAFEVFE